METPNEVTDGSKAADVVVSRKIAKPVKVVWDVLMTEEGAEILLGPGARIGAKGEKWKSHDGREGVIRSFHPLEQIRFSWRIDDKGIPVMVSVSLKPQDDESTVVEIEHEHDGVSSREWIEDRWNAALDRIESECL